MPAKTCKKKASRKAKLSVRKIHSVVSCAVADYHGRAYCFCPACRQGYVIVNEGAFIDEVDCARSVHYLTEEAAESAIDKP